MASLVEDIKANGLREAITLHTDGTILDGRNRYRACLDAGVAPRFKEWDGQGTAEAYVISKNLHRRHLDESQRAMIAAKLATATVGGHRAIVGIPTMDVTAADAADLLNVNRSTVFEAKKVLSEGTSEEIKAVQTGKAAVTTTAKKIRKRAKTTKENKPTKQMSNHRVKTPPGKTLEDVCRQGIALESNGANTEQTAKQTGLSLKSYRDSRYIVWLTDTGKPKNQAIGWLRRKSVPPTVVGGIRSSQSLRSSGKCRFKRSTSRKGDQHELFHQRDPLCCWGPLPLKHTERLSGFH